MPSLLAVSMRASPVAGVDGGVGFTMPELEAGVIPFPEARAEASENSFLAIPIDLASSGIFFGPNMKKTRTITAITISSSGSNIAKTRNLEYIHRGVHSQLLGMF